MSKTHRSLTAVVAAATLPLAIAPAAALAHGGHGHGPHGRHVVTKHERHATAYAASGTVTAVDAAAKTVTVQVKRASSNGRSLVGQQVTYTLAGARLHIADGNGDGARDLGDVAIGDRVQVVVKDAAVAGQPVPAKLVVDRDAKKRAPIRVVYRGSVTAVDAAAKTVTLQAGGLRPGGERLGFQTTETFTLANAKLDVRDRNADGVRDLADVAAGDRVGVLVQVPRTGTLTRPLAALRLEDRGGQRHHG